MSPEEIAEDQDLDVAAVKSGLIQCSARYRRDCNIELKEPEGDDRLNFSDEQLRAVNDVIYETALGAEDPILRFKAACYVRDDKKGRKEVIKAVQNGGINILTINNAIMQAREGARKLKHVVSEPKLIET